MLWDRLKYEKLQQPDVHELVTISREPLFPNDFDTTTAYKGVDPIQRHDVRTSNDELAPDPYGQKRWKRVGWRVGALLACCGAAFAFLINLVTAIVVVRSKGTKHGVSTLYTGSCKRTETMNTWIHLAINALSTLLLSGSNYCMQCLCAPTREEVDAAHAKRKWLDIGVPSIRNLREIDKKKVFLWWALGLSSVPLHLMYNSVFFSAIATNDYYYLYAAEGFSRGAWFNETSWPTDSEFNGTDLQKQAPTFENLTSKACIQAYARDFISNRRNVILVLETYSVNGTPPEGSLLDVNYYTFVSGADGQYDPYAWMCEEYNGHRGGDCSRLLPAIERSLDAGYPWMVGDTAYVKYCLSERVPESCSLHFSLILIIVVIACNLGKLTAMSIIVFRLADSRPLITVGDAVDSFMQKKDDTTRGLCLATWETFDEYDKSFAWRMNEVPKPLAWVPTRWRWARAASSLRWFTCIALFAMAIILVIVLLTFGITQLNGAKNAHALWQLGFGAVQGKSLIKGWSMPSGGAGLIAFVLIGNLPQPILSFLYLIFNGLCTCMFLAHEWGKFGSEKKSLRVSHPRGQQRSTYFLQLPYRWGIPLVVMSGILHWLVSQSIFLAKVTEMDNNGIPVDTGGVTTCGYSPMAIISTVIVGSLLLICGIGIGFRPLNPNMPVAASCSAAISAACHGFPEGIDASYLPVQWGAVATEDADPDEVGHCCFSNEPVTAPVPGHLYAGGADRGEDGRCSSLRARKLENAYRCTIAVK